MHRFVLVHRGDSIELAPGETIVGRAITCRLRFNDPAVSRLHARFMLESDLLSLEDMGSSNGTRVNGLPIVERRRLHHGDHIQIGHRWLQLEVLGEEGLPEGDETIVGQPAGTDQHSTLLAAAEEETLDRGTEWSRGNSDHADEDTVDRSPPIGKPPQNPPSPYASEFSLPAIDFRNCPNCREIVASSSEVCTGCDYRWPYGRPSSVTQRIKLAAIDRRVAERRPVEIPILYASETLTLDTVARDLSPGGMFVGSELLDPVETICRITVLPDGAPAVTLKGIVCHVVQADLGEGGKPPGFGVRFTELSPEAERWLAAALTRGGPRSPHPKSDE